MISDLNNKTSTTPNAVLEVVTTYNKIAENLFDCGIIKGEAAPIVKNANQIQACFTDASDLLFAFKEFPALFKPSNFDL